MTEQLIEQAPGVSELKQKSDVHWARKIWHMGGVSLIAGCYSQLPHSISILLLALVWLLFVPADCLRLKRPALNEFVQHLFGPIMRQNEMHKIAGTSYLLTGIFLVALIFPMNIAILTMLFLAFADPIASYAGIRFGKDKIFGDKSLQGSMAAFFVCSILTFSFLTYHWILMDRLVIVSLLGGLIGSLAELIPVFRLDDNLTLPLISGGALTLLFGIFGAFSAYT